MSITNLHGQVYCISLEPYPEQTGDDVTDTKLFTNVLETPRSLHSLIKTYFKDGLIEF